MFLDGAVRPRCMEPSKLIAEACLPHSPSESAPLFRAAPLRVSLLAQCGSIFISQVLPERQQMVTITAFTEGKCVWCLKRAEGVHAEFKDGLIGFLCRKHFWQALQMRAERTPADTPTPKSTSSTRGDAAPPARPAAGSPFHSEGKD